MSTNPSPSAPIGVFDSGVGGLSVLRAIRAALPHEDLIYLADQARVPYGQRSLEELRELSLAITQFLLSQNAKLIVIACNTASAAALRYLRESFPEIPFVGMEPAVKPAAEQTHTGKVGVLATPSTFHGELYASVVERFASDVQIYQETCPGLVEQIEKADLSGLNTRRILEDALLPLMEKGVDTLVMGCTHFPFVIPLINEITAGHARVIDPAPAVARQVARVLEKRGLNNTQPASGFTTYFSTGSQAELARILPVLTGEQAPVSALSWQDGVLIHPGQKS